MAAIKLATTETIPSCKWKELQWKIYNMEQQRGQDNDLLKLLCLMLWSNNVIFGKEEYALCMNPLSTHSRICLQ